jgi:hypothetical protein
MVGLMPRGPSAWVLNLDAEHELRTSDAHTPSARTMQRMPDWLHALAPLLGPGDVVLGEDDTLTEPRWGRAWCPTAWALRRLVKAGATPVVAPDMTVLRRVNHRRFNAELGQTLPGARFVTTIEELAAVIAGESPSGQWLLKRPFGFAGRGRRRVAHGLLDPSAATWVDASLRAGDGLQVEPWVERTADYALHGFLSQSGVLTVGEATRQTCDDAGAWQGTALAADLEPREAESLLAATRRAAEALRGAGYFGPFGVDAYRWRAGVTIQFNSRGEINARYSMGWATGMQRCRVDLA